MMLREPVSQLVWSSAMQMVMLCGSLCAKKALPLEIRSPSSLIMVCEPYDTSIMGWVMASGEICWAVGDSIHSCGGHSMQKAFSIGPVSMRVGSKVRTPFSSRSARFCVSSSPDRSGLVLGGIGSGNHLYGIHLVMSEAVSTHLKGFRHPAVLWRETQFSQVQDPVRLWVALKGIWASAHASLTLVTLWWSQMHWA
ncbi:hypothetical protein M404DRAFT_943490 [Pisolithus tinctorius Marx 270]|uniref:Uncharacterized protein n=1 Tax=Pisolithus tinctorius Marx 270 TaxID=870435 RepID=A0A0C3PXP8_PISTI|nr:hypothetical protein M404DRAFT_943490 [Pisolithus tinctorius Marx 270]